MTFKDRGICFPVFLLKTLPVYFMTKWICQWCRLTQERIKNIGILFFGPKQGDVTAW